MRWLLPIILSLFALPVLACPVAEPVSTRAPDLFAALKAAPSERAGRVHEDAIWQLWVTAPDAASQALLDHAFGRLRVADYTGAETALTGLIERCPDYAEGYNQRAYAKFLQGRFDASLEDILLTLEREPQHFGALSGRARILFQQGRVEPARRALDAALAVNPWLRERHLLPLGPIGEEL
ncbi:MAG: hypothetical protein AAGI70_13940 [Pseudomonadota bacterium]